MFRFTIRDVLWLMVVVGMAIAWRSEYVRQSLTRTQLRGVVTALEAAGVEVEVEQDHIRAKASRGFDSYVGLDRSDPRKPAVTVDVSSNP
jgi:hypothetical protein